MFIVPQVAKGWKGQVGVVAVPAPKVILEAGKICVCQSHGIYGYSGLVAGCHVHVLVARYAISTWYSNGNNTVLTVQIATQFQIVPYT